MNLGNNYFCESGKKSMLESSYQLFSNDPLWDGDGCDAEEEMGCCQFPGLPWFSRNLATATDDLLS